MAAAINLATIRFCEQGRVPGTISLATISFGGGGAGFVDDFNLDFNQDFRAPEPEGD